jgi:hypothetical protein
MKDEPPIQGSREHLRKLNGSPPIRRVNHDFLWVFSVVFIFTAVVEGFVASLWMLMDGAPFFIAATPMLMGLIGLAVLVLKLRKKVKSRISK